MVMKPGTYQASFNAGELAPELLGNWGLKQYYSGLSYAQNIQPVPQGGFDLLPRTVFLEDLGPPASAAARLIAFNYTLDIVYQISLEPGQARIFRDAAQVAIVALPYTAADIQLVRAVQRSDTMVLEHVNYASQRIIRQGDDTTWAVSPTPWTNMPQVQYSGTYVNTDEVWEIQLQWTSGTQPQNQQFQLTVDGEATVMITIPVTVGGTTVDFAALAVAIKAALEDLSGVAAGITVVYASTGTSGPYYLQYNVTFSGGTNSGGNFILSGSFPLITTMALTTARTVKGVLGGEDVMSTARGWPRCTVYYQDRLMLAGFAAKPAAVLASRTGEYFDLNIKLTADSGAMLFNLDADGAEAILHMIEGAYLVFFSSKAMYHLSDRALKVSAAPNIVKSPQAEGSTARVPPVIQETSILYVNKAETIVYSATYDAITTTFQAAPLSIMASQLFSYKDAAGKPQAYGVVDAALQKSHVATDAQRLFLPRGDGQMIVACLIRNQDVQPFVRWVTDGQVRAVCVDDNNTVTLLVDRLVNGVTHRFREQLVDGLLLDAAVSFTFLVPTAVITGLTMHEGATVWALVDGYVEGPFTVAGGQITLDDGGLSVTVGRWTAPIATTLPLARDVNGQRMVLKRPARVHTVQVDLIETTSFAVGANGQSPKDVAFARAGDLADVPTPPFTGEKMMTGLNGFTNEGLVTITQLRPGRLQVRDVTIQARI